MKDRQALPDRERPSCQSAFPAGECRGQWNCPARCRWRPPAAIAIQVAKDQGAFLRHTLDNGNSPLWQACDLQVQFVLVRPEPRHRFIGPLPAEHVFDRHTRLVTGIAPGFEAQALIAENGMGEGTAITNRENMGIRCLEIGVAGDAIVQGKACLLGQLDARCRPIPAMMTSAAISRPSERTIVSAEMCAMLALVKIATPASAWRAAMRLAISGGTPRMRTRGCASITVTRQPRLAALAASSSPIKPPPMMATLFPLMNSDRILMESARSRSRRARSAPACESRRGSAPVAINRRS